MTPLESALRKLEKDRWGAPDESEHELTKVEIEALIGAAEAVGAMQRALLSFPPRE